jgi:hypothetical protein
MKATTTRTRKTGSKTGPHSTAVYSPEQLRQSEREAMTRQPGRPRLEPTRENVAIARTVDQLMMLGLPSQSVYEIVGRVAKQVLRRKSPIDQKALRAGQVKAIWHKFRPAGRSTGQTNGRKGCGASGGAVDASTQGGR